MPGRPVSGVPAARRRRRAALDGECDKVAAAPTGGRNHTLNTSAFRVFQLVAGGQVDDGEARAALELAALRCGLSPSEIGKTIKSAADAGKAEPRFPETVGVTDAPPLPADLLDPTGSPATSAPTLPAGTVIIPMVIETAGPSQLRNYRLIGNDQGEQMQVGRNPAEMMGDVLCRGDGWPKVIAEILMKPPRRKNEPPTPIKGPNGLFSWLNQIFPGDKALTRVDWSAKGSDKLSKAEFLEYLTDCVPDQYDSFSLFPHWPPVPRVLYLHPELPEPTPDRRYLRRFRSHFTHTPQDDDLIELAVLTMFWGGEAGGRPGFMITSEEKDDTGVGSGKTTVAQVLAKLVGGHILVKTDNDDPASVIVDPRSAFGRVCLIDNLKSHHFSSQTIESMITGEWIQGHRMYVGLGKVANLYTWFLTVNRPPSPRLRQPVRPHPHPSRRSTGRSGSGT